MYNLSLIRRDSFIIYKCSDQWVENLKCVGADIELDIYTQFLLQKMKNHSSTFWINL